LLTRFSMMVIHVYAVVYDPLKRLFKLYKKWASMLRTITLYVIFPWVRFQPPKTPRMGAVMTVCMGAVMTVENVFGDCNIPV
jgi:hypothetical protein